MCSSAKLKIENCEQIVQICSNRENFKKGKDQDEISILERRVDGVGCCLVIGFDGLILDIGFDDEIGCKYTQVSQVINGMGCSVIPGLIDSHCHPVWAGDRVFEFDAKTRGDSYLDIHKKGGGIHYTVSQTKAVPEDELLRLFNLRLKDMISCGTTLVECKTGYGLDLETEIKLLNVIERAKQSTQIDLVTTFLGAHAIPRGMTSEEGVESVIQIMREISKSKEYKIEFIDVFCEKGVYDVKQSEKILLSGKEILKAEIAFHGEELNQLGSAEMAAIVKAKSVSHLEFISDIGIKALSDNEIVAIICPTTLYLLKLKSPPVRRMIEQNVIIAIGSDFNPNAMCYSLSMAMNIAVIMCGLTLNESLAAVTINAAFGLNRSQTHGSLEVGKYGDCLVINASDWRHIVYEFGDSRNLIKHVIKRGSILL